MIINLTIFFLLGLLFGSLLNSIIYRFFNNLSLWERSICPICKIKLKARDLIPLLSYLILKARCRYCNKKISFYYFLVELLTGFIFALFYFKYQSISLFLVRDLFFVLVLIFILFFDLKYYQILDKVIWFSVLFSFIFNIYLGATWWDLLLGAFIAGVFFAVQYFLTRGQGIGFGDVMLGILIGIMLGWQLTVLTIFIGYMIGGIVAVFLLVSKKKTRKDVLPLGSFLALGAILALLIGQEIFILIF